MNNLMGVARPQGRARTGATRASIREVSLVGRPTGAWSAGERLDRAGRSYRVVAGSPRYVHLRPEPPPS